MSNSIDFRSFARKTIEYEHASIHAERGWDCDIEFTLSTTTPKYFHLRTTTKEVHLKDFLISTDKAEVKLWLYKSPNLTLNQSPDQITIFNSDDDSLKNCSFFIYTNSTVVNEGTKRKTYYLAGSQGVGQSQSGDSQTNPFWEYILKINSDYLIKIQRITSDGDTTGVLRVRAYEEDEGVE